MISPQDSLTCTAKNTGNTQEQDKKKKKIIKKNENNPKTLHAPLLTTYLAQSVALEFVAAVACDTKSLTSREGTAGLRTPAELRAWGQRQNIINVC